MFDCKATLTYTAANAPNIKKECITLDVTNNEGKYAVFAFLYEQGFRKKQFIYV